MSEDYALYDGRGFKKTNTNAIVGIGKNHIPLRPRQFVNQSSRVERQEDGVTPIRWYLNYIRIINKSCIVTISSPSSRRPVPTAGVAMLLKLGLFFYDGNEIKLLS